MTELADPLQEPPQEPIAVDVQDDADETLILCPSCEEPGTGYFCASCGENLHARTDFSIRNMVRHLLSDWFHFDTRFFQTYKTLLFKPGELTKNHLAGRRVNFIKPLAMYMGMSAIYFLALSIFQPFTIGELLFGTHIDAASSDSIAVEQPNVDIADIYSIETQQRAHQVYQELLSKTSETMGISKAEVVRRFDRRYNAMLPIYMALSVIFFAFGLKVINWQRYYYEHLIFAMHFFTFMFLTGMFTVFLLKYSFLWTALGSSVVYAIYIWFALKKVHEQSNGLTTLKALMTIGGYYATIIIGSVIVMLILIVMMAVGKI